LQIYNTFVTNRQSSAFFFVVQFTDKELELLFDGDKNKVRLIDKYLKKKGLHLYHSDLLSYKLSRKIRQLLDQSKKD